MTIAITPIKPIPFPHEKYGMYYVEEDLRDAAYRGDLKRIQALITSYPKLNLNAVNEYGESALYIACKRDQNTVAEFLLNKSEVNKNAATILGNSPMLIAAWRDNNEIARKLIENGADVNARTNANRQYHGGVSALDVAKERGNQMLVDLLKPLVENNLSHQPKP